VKERGGEGCPSSLCQYPSSWLWLATRLATDGRNQDYEMIGTVKFLVWSEKLSD